MVLPCFTKEGDRMNITFYQFAKRTNSTKIVNVSGTTLSCELKGAATIFNPGLIIKAVPNNWSPIWNYCYIPAFSRYYFVNNWNWLNGVWECSLICDVLASFKTEIGNMSEYIMRSSYESDGRIEDSAYIAKAEVTTNMTAIPDFFVRTMTAGFYVIGIIGKESTATQGAITYYQMSADQMARLRAYMLSDTFLADNGLTNLTDFIPADATKVVYNPYQYIVSCQWFPLAMNAIGSDYKTSVSTIDFGWWNTGTGFSAYRISANAPYYTRSENISLTSHPQISRGEYLNHAPYTSRIIRFSPFSEVQLPDEYLDSGNHITLEFQCDFITGIGNLLVHARDSNNVELMLITRLSQKIGVDIQLAQVGTDYLGTQTTVVRDNAGFIGDVAGALSNIDLSSFESAALSGFSSGIQAGISYKVYEASALNNYLKAKAPQLLTSGSNGSFIGLAQNNYLCSTFYKIVDEDNPQLGRPLCKIRTISNIPGFIMVRNPDVSLACFEVERSLITQFLQSGFFYE